MCVKVGESMNSAEFPKLKTEISALLFSYRTQRLEVILAES